MQSQKRQHGATGTDDHRGKTPKTSRDLQSNLQFLLYNAGFVSAAQLDRDYQTLLERWAVLTLSFLNTTKDQDPNSFATRHVLKDQHNVPTDEVMWRLLYMFVKILTSLLHIHELSQEELLNALGLSQPVREYRNAEMRKQNVFALSESSLSNNFWVWYGSLEKFSKAINRPMFSRIDVEEVYRGRHELFWLIERKSSLSDALSLAQKFETSDLTHSIVAVLKAQSWFDFWVKQHNAMATWIRDPTICPPIVETNAGLRTAMDVWLKQYQRIFGEKLLGDDIEPRIEILGQLVQEPPEHFKFRIDEDYWCRFSKDTESLRGNILLALFLYKDDNWLFRQPALQKSYSDFWKTTLRYDRFICLDSKNYSLYHAQMDNEFVPQILLETFEKSPWTTLTCPPAENTEGWIKIHVLKLEEESFDPHKVLWFKYIFKDAEACRQWDDWRLQWGEQVRRWKGEVEEIKDRIAATSPDTDNLCYFPSALGGDASDETAPSPINILDAWENWDVAQSKHWQNEIDILYAEIHTVELALDNIDNEGFWAKTGEWKDGLCNAIKDTCKNLEESKKDKRMDRFTKSTVDDSISTLQEGFKALQGSSTSHFHDTLMWNAILETVLDFLKKKKDIYKRILECPKDWACLKFYDWWSRHFLKSTTNLLGVALQESFFAVSFFECLETTSVTMNPVYVEAQRKLNNAIREANDFGRTNTTPVKFMEKWSKVITLIRNMEWKALVHARKMLATKVLRDLRSQVVGNKVTDHNKEVLPTTLAGNFTSDSTAPSEVMRGNVEDFMNWWYRGIETKEITLKKKRRET